MTHNNFINSLKGRRLIVVTNREPYIHTYNAEKADREVLCSIPAGGVTAALDPVMQDVGGVWVAWGSGDADHEKVDDRNRVAVPPLKPKYTLKRVWLTKSEVSHYYYGYCNEGLWPLAHSLVSKIRFEKRNWTSYVNANLKFAQAVLEVCGDDDIVWVHDYHLTLVPEMLKARKRNLKVVFFWHIPWPQYDIFRICPQHRQILRGLSSCDLVGFHIARYCRNFSECMDRAFEFTGNNVPRKPSVAWFPISIDFEDIERQARNERTVKTIRRLVKQHRLEGRLISCGVDRMDYTKGVPERLEAIEILFDKYPEYRERYTHVQICSPTRGEIAEYRQVKKRVVELTERINAKFGTENWVPLIVFHKKVPFETIAALYRMADIAIVSPLTDGMNLVAKEFIAAQVEEKGVLLLSSFAGAAGIIEHALKFNPFEKDSFAEHIKAALDMPVESKKTMIRKARADLSGYTIFDWVDEFLHAVTEGAAHNYRELQAVAENG